MRKTIMAAAFVGTTGLGMGAALATPQICDYRAPEQWRPKAEIEALAADLGKQMGFDKFFVQPDGGCWGVYARTPEGAKLEILLDPMTKAIVRQGRS